MMNKEEIQKELEELKKNREAHETNVLKLNNALEQGKMIINSINGAIEILEKILKEPDIKKEG